MLINAVPQGAVEIEQKCRQRARLLMNVAGCLRSIRENSLRRSCAHCLRWRGMLGRGPISDKVIVELHRMNDRCRQRDRLGTHDKSMQLIGRWPGMSAHLRDERDMTACGVDAVNHQISGA